MEVIEDSSNLATDPRLRNIKILHGTVDIAWQASTLARQLREQGYQSYSLAQIRADWGPRPDVFVDCAAVAGWHRMALQVAGLIGALPTFDLFHIHFGRSLLYNNIDVPLLRALGKTLIFHFHGTDIRLQATERAVRGWRAPKVPPPTRYFCWCKARRLSVARDYGSKVIVSTPDLLDVVPEAVHVPVALDLDSWPLREPRPTPRRLLIAHSPTDVAFKGTGHLQTAVERLRSEDIPIDLDIIQGVPHRLAAARIKNADLFVDQLGVGWYGLAAVEAMAQGVPTICYIREDLAQRMAPLPFIRAERNTIEEVLRGIWLARDMLPPYALAGRQFVEGWHDVRIIVQRLLSIYSKALAL